MWLSRTLFHLIMSELADASGKCGLGVLRGIPLLIPCGGVRPWGRPRPRRATNCTGAALLPFAVRLTRPPMKPDGVTRRGLCGLSVPARRPQPRPTPPPCPPGRRPNAPKHSSLFACPPGHTTQPLRMAHPIAGEGVRALSIPYPHPKHWQYVCMRHTDGTHA